MPTEISYLLEVPPVPAAMVATEAAVGGPLERRGIVIPFRRDKKQDFANDSGEALITSNVRQILGTRVGELRWEPEFGSLLHTLRHRNNKPLLKQLAHTHVVDALRRWEPRVRVTSTDVDTTTFPRKLLITVKYAIVDPNSPGITVVSGLSTEVPVLPLAA